LISNHFGDSVSGPEKAGVGGSIPSLATIIFNNLAIVENMRQQSLVVHRIRPVKAEDFRRAHAGCDGDEHNHPLTTKRLVEVFRTRSRLPIASFNTITTGSL